MEALPDWRMHGVREILSGEFANVASRFMVIMEYENDQPMRMVSKVTSAYTFVSPRTWLSDIVNAIGGKLMGDVSIMSVQSTHNTVLVELKLPKQFNLTADSTDDFGLTMVASNPYSGVQKQTLGIGAIRGACTNGCIFGDHKKIQIAHRGKGDKLESYVHTLLEEAAPMAQGYLAKLVKTSLSKPAATSEYEVRKALHDGDSPVCRAIMQTELAFWQKLLVAKTALKRPGDSCSLYELWNDFTNVASHQFPSKYDKLSLRIGMLHVINRAFDTGGVVAQSLCKDADTIKFDVKAVRARGWEKQWWWSFDPATPYGPHTRKETRKRKDCGPLACQS